MAKITRVTSIIFAGGAASQDIEQFGSAVQGGSPVYTTDPAVIQARSAWSDGWSAALVVDNKSEYKQDRNAVDYVASCQISYLLQQGIAEWDAGTPYYTNSIVQHSGNFYLSLTDANLNNTPPASVSNSFWQILYFLGNAPQPTTTVLTSGSGTYTPPTGCVRIAVQMVGGGGGASGAGGNTTFGGFTASAGSGGAGGAGGAASGGSVNIAGAAGSTNGQSGASFFGGAGTSTVSAATNSGSGAGGGGSGGYVEGSVSAPGATSYAVGAAGSGTQAGGSGLIIIQEFYY